MVDDNITNIFLKKYQTKTLANFYILRHSNLSESTTLLQNCIFNFLAKTISQNKKIPLNQAMLLLESGHQDILIIKKNDEDKEYSLKNYNFDELFNIRNYNPIELNYKFVAVFDAHCLSQTISNKLLATLEGPGKMNSIFFINPSSKMLLPTIESRAIKITINETLTSESRPFLSSEKNDVEKNIQKLLATPKYLAFSEKIKMIILEYLNDRKKIWPLLDALSNKDKQEMQQLIVDLIVENESDLNSDYATKGQLLKELSWFYTSKLFNNAPSERLFSIIKRCL